MHYALVLVLLYGAMVILQPLAPALMGQTTWLIGLSPLLLVYGALRAGDFSLLLFVLAGGALHDLILLHYIGMGPLLWLLTVLLVRSQRDWLRNAHWSSAMVVTFAGAFFYLAMDRVFFLVYNGLWAWTFELSSSLMIISAFNALASPMVFRLFDFILRAEALRQPAGTVRRARR
ncbi:MAG: hypothetical protein SFU85_11040 [Candidatus Methylacidiphilales bacterium]|nr:hypothetical protein [Candidatus Methylacidiphilales bacterium]